MSNSSMTYILRGMTLAAYLLMASGSVDAVAQSPVRVTLSCGAAGMRSEAYTPESVDEAPSFPGGDAAMMRYINTERRYPRTAYDNAVEGRVLCGFIVEPDGTLSNLEVVRGVEESLNREALRVIDSMPDWSPGVIGGQPVRVYMLVAVPFRR